MSERRYLGVEDRSQMIEQEIEELLYGPRGRDVIDTLTYNHYRWQREYYGIAAERLAAHYPLAHKYEERYLQEKTGRAA
jgi:hypothetical protein